MPLARIITAFPEESTELAMQLQSRGYRVETVAPGSVPAESADLEVRVDECAVENVVAQVSQSAGGDVLCVYIAPGALDDVARAGVRQTSKVVPYVEHFKQDRDFEKMETASAEVVPVEEPVSAEVGEVPATLNEAEEIAEPVTMAVSAAEPQPHAEVLEPPSAWEESAAETETAEKEPVLASEPVLLESEPVSATLASATGDDILPEFEEESAPAVEASEPAIRAAEPVTEIAEQEPSEPVAVLPEPEPVLAAAVLEPKIAEPPAKAAPERIVSVHEGIADPVLARIREAARSAPAGGRVRSRAEADRAFWRVAVAAAGLAAMVVLVGSVWHRARPMPANLLGPEVRQNVPFQKAQVPQKVIAAPIPKRPPHNLEQPSQVPANVPLAPTKPPVESAVGKPPAAPASEVVVPASVQKRSVVKKSPAKKATLRSSEEGLIAEDTVVFYDRKAGAAPTKGGLQPGTKQYSDVQ